MFAHYKYQTENIHSLQYSLILSYKPTKKTRTLSKCIYVNAGKNEMSGAGEVLFCLFVCFFLSFLGHDFFEKISA